MRSDQKCSGRMDLTYEVLQSRAIHLGVNASDRNPLQTGMSRNAPELTVLVGRCEQQVPLDRLPKDPGKQ